MKVAGKRIIVWPKDVEKRYGISAVTRWRWEGSNKIPQRDVRLAGERVAWYLSTIEAAESSDRPLRIPSRSHKHSPETLALLRANGRAYARKLECQCGSRKFKKHTPSHVACVGCGNTISAQ